MGLYDGSDWHDERGSTAQIAKLLQAPVLLVMDISGSARSAAAEALGYKSFDTAVELSGGVLNFAGSERHALGCAEAIAAATGLPMLGWLPRDLQLRIPERHLGLIPGGEQVNSTALVGEMAGAVAARFDVSGIVEIARRAAAGSSWSVGSTVPEANFAGGGACGEASIGPSGATGGEASIGPSGATDGEASVSHVRAQPRATRPVIAVARDEAFCFYYPENLELLIEEGARIEFFSPLRGERPLPSAKGVYLGGGYPELHGPALQSNTSLWNVLRELHAADAPMYAECGGFMVLTQALTDSGGRCWPMAGLLPGVARMTGKLAALGYRQATAVRSNLLAEAGDSLRGHEFRYSTWVCDGEVLGAGEATAAWHVRGTRHDAPTDTVGYARGNLLASYLHVHFGQRRELARRFVQHLDGRLAG
jgi:cobyrinic acid a,c-diamide synthase